MFVHAGPELLLRPVGRFRPEAYRERARSLLPARLPKSLVPEPRLELGRGCPQGILSSSTSGDESTFILFVALFTLRALRGVLYSPRWDEKADLRYGGIPA